MSRAHEYTLPVHLAVPAEVPRDALVLGRVSDDRLHVARAGEDLQSWWVELRGTDRVDGAVDQWLADVANIGDAGARCILPELSPLPRTMSLMASGN